MSLGNKIKYFGIYKIKTIPKKYFLINYLYQYKDKLSYCISNLFQDFIYISNTSFVSFEMFESTSYEPLRKQRGKITDIS